MKKTILFMLMCAIFLTGCGGKKWNDIGIFKEKYDMANYKGTTVGVADLTPKFEIKISRDGIKRMEYGETNSELTLEKVHVNLGDKVNEGDILVSFQSREIKENITRYNEMIESNNLQMDHYQRLMQIDKNSNYTKAIEGLREDNNLYQLYVEEEMDKLKAYQIVALYPGTITYIDENLTKGYFKPGKGLIVESYGAGEYASINDEDYEFKIGTTCTAYADGIPYEFEVSKLDETNKKVFFNPLSDVSALSDTDKLTATISKDEVKNAVYVDTKAIEFNDDRAYVYVLDEDGYRTAVLVEPGDEVGDFTIIKSGLKGGEKVTLN